MLTKTLKLQVACLIAATFCGCGTKSPPCQQAPASASSNVPASNHVVMVVEENHSYSSVIGNSSMPYFNSLANQYGLATQYFADTHPSIGNYFMLTTGQIISNDDSFSGTVSADNVVRHLLSAGKTWKSYAESLPSVGYTGGDVYPYLKHHNPFAYFSDVVNTQNQLQRLVPFTQFAPDLANGQLPDFSFIVPNVKDDAHDGSLNQADSWLQSNVGPLLSSATFQQDGLLVIVFDESDQADSKHGGGHVALVLVGPKVKKGHQSSVCSQHENTLRTMGQALDISSFPGEAANVSDFSEFF